MLLLRIRINYYVVLTFVNFAYKRVHFLTGNCYSNVMNYNLFVGRSQELKDLQRYLKKRSASLIVIKGRRRVGKSRLVEEFARDLNFYSFAGLLPDKKVTDQDQRNEFARQLSEYFPESEVNANDWSNLFFFLSERVKKGRIVILLDEISWMGSLDPTFLGKLKNAWDRHFKKNPELILILCGSTASWIEDNILSSTGFLGRVSFTLTVEELPLKACNQFWANVGAKISAYEKFKILMITGGIPRYLEEIQPEKPADENIRNLCFKKGGILVDEFERIFSDLFSKKSGQYKNIVKALSEAPLEYGEVCKAIGMESSGLMSEYLNNLILSGFISRDYTWHIKSEEHSAMSHYRLRDNYLRFYLKYIEKHLPEIENGIFQIKSISALPEYSTIMGLQFENLVLQNRHLIQETLNLRAEDIVYDNPFFQRSTNRMPGCQIDYLIQTRFNTLFAFEVKFSRHPIQFKIISEMKEKLNRLVLPRGFSCCPVLIHVNGVEDRVLDSGYFTEVIDFSRYLE